MNELDPTVKPCPAEQDLLLGGLEQPPSHHLQEDENICDRKETEAVQGTHFICIAIVAHILSL